MQQLADASGLAVQTVHRYLTGKRDIPVNVLADMCEALNVTAHDVVQRAERRYERQESQSTYGLAAYHDGLNIPLGAEPNEP